MNDLILLSAMLVACTLVLAAGAVHGLRTGLDHASVTAITGFALFAGLMGTGAIMQAMV